MAQNKILFTSGATCMPVDCCFSDLALKQSNSVFDLEQIKCRHRIERKLVFTMKKLKNHLLSTHKKPRGNHREIVYPL